MSERGLKQPAVRMVDFISRILWFCQCAGILVEVECLSGNNKFACIHTVSAHIQSIYNNI